MRLCDGRWWVLAGALLAMIAAGCVTTEDSAPAPAAAAPEPAEVSEPAAAPAGEASRAYAEFRAAVAASGKNSGNAELLDEVVRLARLYVKQYIAEESRLPQNDLWKRRDYLRSFQKTGMVFDNDVDFILRARERQIMSVESGIARAEASTNLQTRLDIIRPLMLYAPYSDRIQAIRGGSIQLYMAGAEKLELKQRLLRLYKMKQHEPLPKAVDEQCRLLVAQSVGELRALPLPVRVDRVVQIASFVPHFPELAAFKAETLDALKAGVSQQVEAGRMFEAVRLCVIGKRLWPDEALFEEVPQGVFADRMSKSLAKSEEFNAACAAKRLATQFLYALSAWRFGPSSAETRAKVINLSQRFAEAYPLTVALKEEGGDPLFVGKFLRGINAQPVVVVLRNELEDKSAVSAFLSIKFSQAAARTQQSRMADMSTYSAGSGDRASFPSYRYMRITYTISPTVVLTYSFTDGLDGKKYETGSFRRSKDVVLESIEGVHPRDANGLVNRPVDLDGEIPKILNDFAQEIGAEFSAEIREKSERLLLRAAQRALSKGFLDEGRDRMLAYKYLDVAAAIMEYGSSGEMMCRAMGFDAIPSRLETMLQSLPAGAVQSGQKEFDWSDVVRETASYGKRLPDGYVDQGAFIESWDPEIVECREMPASLIPKGVWQMFQ